MISFFRYMDNIELMKHYVFDLFYFKSPRNHLLIGHIIGKAPLYVNINH